MRLISVEHALPGQHVAKNIYDSEGRLLLPKGVRLRAAAIESLKLRGITMIYVSDGSEETKAETIRVVRAAMEKVKLGASFQANPIEEVVAKLVDEMLADQNLLLRMVDIRSRSNSVFAHCTGVAVISLVIGATLGYDHGRLRELGTGALLHDLGKSKIPATILDKPGKLSDAEFAVMKTHCSEGYHAIEGLNGISRNAAAIALQHHERFDGAGYPVGLKGTRILEYARIAAIADVYDALTEDRPYRNRLMPDEVVEIIRAYSGTHFDPMLVRVFLDSIAIYPVGLFVQLNTGEIGTVEEVTTPTTKAVGLLGSFAASIPFRIPEGSVRARLFC